MLFVIVKYVWICGRSIFFFVQIAFLLLILNYRAFTKYGYKLKLRPLFEI